MRGDEDFKAGRFKRWSEVKKDVGGFRIVYEVNIKDKTVEIKSIRGRGDVYKQ